MKTGTDAAEADVPYETIASDSEDSMGRNELEWVDQSIARQKAALEADSAVLKDQILRSALIKQPEGTNKADDIIVDEVMTAAEIEANKAALIAVVVDEVAWSPITVTTDSSSDLD